MPNDADIVASVEHVMYRSLLVSLNERQRGAYMGMVFCRGCGKEIHESAVSCPHCGCQQIAAVSGGVKNQSVATLLAAFVGGFGIHRFYLSRPISGVLYLLFFWTAIPGFIALIETFIYAFTSQMSWAQKYNHGQLSAPVHVAIKILVLIVPVICMVGILAAIAIPAYQGYVMSTQQGSAAF